MSEIKEKVISTVAYLLDNNITPSISNVCRYGEINRSNLYSSHPDLIEKIKSYRKSREPNSERKSHENRITTLQEENFKLKQQAKTLAYSCIELKYALDAEKNKTERLLAELQKFKAKK